MRCTILRPFRIYCCSVHSSTLRHDTVMYMYASTPVIQIYSLKHSLAFATIDELLAFPHSAHRPL